MAKCALLKNNTVIEIKDLLEEQIKELAPLYDLIVNIDEYIVSPSVGWILSGNRLVPTSPEGLSPEEIYAGMVRQFRHFGEKLSGELTDKIGARNLILGKSEAQIAALVSSLAPIGMLLEKGGLKTARSLIVQAKASNTEYADIFDYAIDSITAYVGP